MCHELLSPDWLNDLLDMPEVSAAPLASMSVEEFNAWAQSLNVGPVCRAVRYRLWVMRIAMGNGALEERLIRLMVHLANSVTHTSTHSGIAHPIFVLLEGRAWCDQYATVFAHLANKFFGVPTRVLHLIMSDRSQGHFVTEVHYGHSWHLFDPHPDHLNIYRHPGSGVVLPFVALQQQPEIVAAVPTWCKKEEFFRLPPVGVQYCWEFDDVHVHDLFSELYRVP